MIGSKLSVPLERFIEEPLEVIGTKRHSLDQWIGGPAGGVSQSRLRFGKLVEFASKLRPCLAPSSFKDVAERQTYSKREIFERLVEGRTPNCVHPRSCGRQDIPLLGRVDTKLILSSNDCSFPTA